MYSLEVIIAAAAAAIVIGLIVGVSIGRRTSASGQKYREVERKLDQMLQDKKLYEDEVVDHFQETAQLLNKLTDSYRDVHNHLATGAVNLCQGEGPVQLERMSDQNTPAELPADLKQVQPPLDYAPKTSPDEKGMLNEEFGLDRPAGEKPSAGPEPQKA